MTYQFLLDLEGARASEELVTNYLSTLTDEYKFENVGNVREYFYKGDIKATNLATGEIHMLEIKDDSRIATTHNILCEESSYFFNSKSWRKGNFYSDYEYYCIYSRSESKLYIFDFSILKKIYKKGRLKSITHHDNINEVYLLPLETAKEAGALIAELDI